MANYSRTDRVSEEVKRELSAVIRELKDPRLPVMVTVVAVNVTKDLKFAKAHISIMGNEEVKNNALAALKSASGFIRREIGHRLNLRNTPEFTFVSDNSIEYGAHINEILKEL
ncbi:MAG: 30S ribosome-binding factor RbfA [Clostridia bacterium]|nr:30S ribosome-binding factor RbfA [Bacteroidales bacterium]MBQ7109406.1 30S ribosome-binding factor RbfA [Clostridia bacterium]